jgi:intracellular sulfur oxidation DsrE/DsrF family protein
MWTRRGLWGFGFIAAVSGAKTAAMTAKSHQPNVVYHLADLDRVAFALGNIHNHFAGTKDEDVQISLVVLGGALRAFHAASAPSDVGERFRDLIENNRLLALACSNSLRAQGITIDDLIPGFRAVEAGVVTIAQLQSSGCAYIRP